MLITLLLLLIEISKLPGWCSVMEPKIIGGSYTSVKKNPHVAYILILCVVEKETTEYGCGASILNQRLLLTAGHCLEECDKTTRIEAFFKEEQSEKGKKHLSKNFLIHNDYNSTAVANDIAIIALNRMVRLGPLVKRVALMRHPPKTNDIFVSGWGLIDERNSEPSLYLKTTQQKLLSHLACEHYLEEIPKGTICADGIKEPEIFGHPVEGDSGSALVANGYVQIGLVSYKIAVIGRSIVVYTDTAYHLPWIKKAAKSIYCKG